MPYVYAERVRRQGFTAGYFGREGGGGGLGKTGELEISVEILV